MTKAVAQKEKEKQATPSMLDSLVAFNVIRTFRPLLEPGGGWFIDPETKKITPLLQGIDWSRSCIFVNPDDRRVCNYFTAIFTHAKFIPSFCLDCWKVVVKAPTVAHLLKIWTWQKEFTKDHMGKDRFCKNMIEERDWVPYPYGAYFYCDSKEDSRRPSG